MGSSTNNRAANTRTGDVAVGRVVTPGFNGRVYSVVERVPKGTVATYGDVATLLGSPRVARHVGFALAALQDPEVPWHRIVNARALISFPGDSERGELQRRLLESEGVEFAPSGRIDFKRFRWDGDGFFE
jgi:methylated-DNA-protein-cysteine methyltransferase-like protein